MNGNDPAKPYLKARLGTIKEIISSDRMFSDFCDALGMADKFERFRHDRFGRVCGILNSWYGRHGNTKATLQLFVDSIKHQFVNLVEDLELTHLLRTGTPTSVLVTGNKPSPPGGPSLPSYQVPSRHTTNAFAKAFNKTVKKENVRDFVNAKSDFFTGICSALNNSIGGSALLQLLDNMEILVGDEIPTIISHLQAEYEKHHATNPSSIIFAQLLEDSPDFGNMTLEKFSELLIGCNYPPLSRVVADWIEFREGRQKEAKERSKETFVGKITLRSWLLRHKVAKSETEVDGLVTKLMDSNIGVDTVDDLVELGFKEENFRRAGFSEVQAMRAAKGVKVTNAAQNQTPSHQE